MHVEEKASVSLGLPEEKASTSVGPIPTIDVSNLGRVHTDTQMDELLDHYAITGETPDYVSERMQRDYRKHRRLLERIAIQHESGQSIHPTIIERLPKLIAYYEEQGYGIKPSVSRVLATLVGSADQSNVVDFVRTKNQRDAGHRSGA